MKLIKGDSYELLKELPDNSVDLVIIDPPYEFCCCGGGGSFGYDKRSYHQEYISLDTHTHTHTIKVGEGVSTSTSLRQR